VVATKGIPTGNLEIGHLASGIWQWMTDDRFQDSQIVESCDETNGYWHTVLARDGDFAGPVPQ
jgi:hypothetical protein